MGEIRLSHCCRLCLKEGFSLTSIFSQCSVAGDPLYQILNCIYEMKIFENDGLPSQICSPCMWRMIEFYACKKNVRCAEAEIMRLLSQTRPDEPSEVEVPMEQRPVNSEVSIKQEFPIVEWVMPADTVIKVPEALQHFQEADKDDNNDNESDDMEPVELPEDEYEEKCNEQVFSQPLQEVPMKEEIDILGWQRPEDLKVRATDIKNVVTEVQDARNVDSANDEMELVKIEATESEEGVYNERISSEQLTNLSQLPEVPNSDSVDTAGRMCLGESSSINTAPEKNVRIRHTNKWTSQKDLRDDVIQAKESLSGEEPISVLHDTEPGPSHLEAPLSNVKNRFICYICKKGFQYKSHLNNHTRVHLNNRLFPCGVCGKRFKQKSLRYQHELRHMKDKMSVGKGEKGSMKKLFSCGTCGKNFGSKRGLKMHCDQHKMKYLCSKCGRSFGSITDHKRHSRVHTKEKPYECQNCFKSFNLKTNLTKHMVTHSSDKSFACEVCKKKLKTIQSKKQHELVHFPHMVTHSSEKPFACEVCEKKFKTKQSKKQHELVHFPHMVTLSSEKPFACKVCEKKFKTKQSKKQHELVHSRHMVTHSSEKPFACKVCEKKFKTKQSKKQHELVHLKKK